MDKVLLAKVTLGIVYTLAVAVALFVLYWIAQFLIWWAGAEIISFSIIIGLISLGLLVVGGGMAWEWATNTIEERKREDAHAEAEFVQEKKIKAYQAQWGEEAVPPRNGETLRFDLPPINRQRGANVG